MHYCILGFPDELFLYGMLCHWSPREVCPCKNSPRNARDVMSVHWVEKVLRKNVFIFSIKFGYKVEVGSRAFPSKLALHGFAFYGNCEGDAHNLCGIMCEVFFGYVIKNPPKVVP